MTRRRTRLAGVAVAMIVVTVPGSAPAHDETHIDSQGIYRIPYEDGLDVAVGRDHHTHKPVENRIDMESGEGEPFVAAASGWIRAAVDTHGVHEDPDVYACQDDDAVPGDCTDYNNYVWIEHPNGEWTKYSHPQTGSVAARGWQVGDWISAGQAIGTEGAIGAASGPHLHWEVAVPDDPTDPTPFSAAGGFIQGTNRAPLICDLPSPYFVAGESYTAAPCDHQAPSADAGGPYVVDEGTPLTLDGTGSTDPDGEPLTFAWSPEAGLTGADTATPAFDTTDDAAADLTLRVYDRVEQRRASDTTTVTVQNVAPSVSAGGDTIAEGQTASVAATVSDPGTADSHTATIDWGDGTSEAVAVAGGALGATHDYGDDGTYTTTVTVTDDDGGVGMDTADVVVANVAPVLTFDGGETVAFPGGDHVVAEPGEDVELDASGQDAGSDDLTFAWTPGGTRTYYNNGVSPEPALPSPGGVFPFLAGDTATVSFAAPGAEALGLVLSDDDGGTDGAAGSVVVIGTADETRGAGWWKHQYAAHGRPQIDPALAEGLREVVVTVSGVFSEARSAATREEVHAILSGGDARERAQAELMVAWLQFASGAVPYDATVPLESGPAAFLDVLADAEAVIADPAATSEQLQAAEHDLKRVRHAA